jgi:hypothetical protein
LEAIDEGLPGFIDTLLFGNFNIDMESEAGLYFRKVLMEEFKIYMRTNPRHYTTKGRRTIDALFSTLPVLQCGVYESVFSFHLPLYARYGQINRPPIEADKIEEIEMR